MSFTLRAVLVMAIAVLFVPQPASSQLLRNGRRQSAEPPVDVEKWVRALQHPEKDVRRQAMGELWEMARDRDNLEAALPTLRKCAEREFPFPTTEEALIHQDQAWKILTLVDPDFIAVRASRILAENFRIDVSETSQNFLLQRLSEIDRVSVDIDADLLQALERGAASNIRMQQSCQFQEGSLLYAYAKLAADRERAAQLVRSRMKWPFGRSCYTRDHFRAMRLCAEHSPGLLQPMWEAYRADLDRGYALTVIASLAVYHDDAWEFFETCLQDEFASRHMKRQMATAFADTWLLAAETVQRRSLDRIEALHTAADWLDWSSTLGGLQHPPAQVESRSLRPPQQGGRDGPAARTAGGTADWGDAVDSYGRAWTMNPTAVRGDGASHARSMTRRPLPPPLSARKGSTTTRPLTATT